MVVGFETGSEIWGSGLKFRIKAGLSGWPGTVGDATAIFRTAEAVKAAIRLKKGGKGGGIRKR